MKLYKLKHYVFSNQHENKQIKTVMDFGLLPYNKETIFVLLVIATV